MKLIRLVAGALVTLGVASTAFAQYPDRPIKMVIGYTPGGAADKLARPLAEEMQKGLGQNFVFDYKPGGGATIALDYLARQPADGYTLHLTDSGPMTIVPHIRKLGYDPLTDFTPLGMVGGGGVVIVVPAKSPATDVASLIALAKKDPAAWSYGTSGVGGVGHLAGEQFKKAAAHSLQGRRTGDDRGTRWSCAVFVLFVGCGCSAHPGRNREGFGGFIC